MSKIKTKNKKENGYAVLELLFYIAFFAILALVVINAMITMTKSFRETSIQGELAQAGVIMERMSREIRQAYGVDVASTDIDLILNKDANSVNKAEFKFISPNIQFWDIGSNIGNLNSPNIIVTGLTFTQIITVKGKAVKILLTVKSSSDALARTRDFYDTIVLRGDY